MDSKVKLSSTPSIIFIFLSVVLVGFPLFSEGMFFDGLTYASISRNLAIGHGSIWHLHYSDFYGETFYDHPPLVFVLQSSLFRLLGDHIWVEYIYSIIAYVAFFLGVRRLISVYAPEQSVFSFFIVGISLLLIPIFSWSFSNNMLENTTAVWMVWAVYFYFLALSQKENKWILFTIIALIFLILGLLSKGPVTLFPIIIPFFYALIYKEWSRAIKVFGLSIIGLVLLLVAFYLNENFKIFVDIYLDRQIISSLSGIRESADNRFLTIKCLFDNLLPLLIPLSLALLIKVYRQKIQLLKINKSQVIFLSIAMSGSLPLLISPKQSCVYIVPSLVFYVLFLLPYIEALVRLLKVPVIHEKKVKTTFHIILFIALIITFTQRKNFVRDMDVIDDVNTMMDIVGQKDQLMLEGLCTDWRLIAYLERYISPVGSCERSNQYVLSRNPNKVGYDKLSQLNIGTLYISENYDK